MSRTTSEAVQGIIETDSSIDVAPFIEVANDLVTEVCVPLEYSDTRLELIERWLSAHFYAIRDNRAAAEAAGSVNQSFQYSVGLNLNVTIYGQQVLVLDTKGGFASLQAQATDGTRRTGASVTWLGTEL